MQKSPRPSPLRETKIHAGNENPVNWHFLSLRDQRAGIQTTTLSVSLLPSDAAQETLGLHFSPPLSDRSVTFTGESKHTRTGDPSNVDIYEDLSTPVSRNCHGEGK